MVLLDRSSARAGSRYGGLSNNMFFVRNCPQPQRVRHLEGLNGAMICNVNDDLTRNRRKRNKSRGLHKNNLPTTETTRRTERLVPPTSFWQAHGILHNTDHWKEDLASLATTSGIELEKDDQKYANKSSTNTDQRNTTRSGAHYSAHTGRFNEGTAKSRGRTSTKHGTAPSDTLFNVSENEKEMWMLQILCQILDTCNLADVQTWLVSAPPAEKEKAGSMINAALRGLKESERASEQTEESVDFDSLSNFVEKKKHEEMYAAQQYVNETLNRSAPVLPSADEHQQQSQYSLNDTWDLTGANGTYGYATIKEDEHYQPEEQIDTIQLIDDRRRPRSTSLTKQSKNYDSPRNRPATSYRQNYNAESMLFNDDPVTQSLNYTNELQNSYEDNDKGRQIVELQNKLSRQEEEAKKKFDELQTKQSRLENAIRLLAKQTASKKKNQKGNSEQADDKPVVNVIIQSPSQKEYRNKSSKPRMTPFIHADKKSKKNRDDNNGAKVGDFNVEDVKVQISLSRLDNHQPKVYGGVWKPDTQIIQRFQGC